MLTIFSSLYKSEEYLDTYSQALLDCAAKLIAQGVKMEVVAVANEPSDVEKDKLNALSIENTWFRYVAVPRETIYASWNRAIDLAKGEIVTSWNADDIRYPEAIIDGLKYFENGHDLVYFPFVYKRYLKLGGFSLLVKRRIVQPDEFQINEFTRSMQCGPFFMFSKEFYKKVGPFDEQFKIVGDFDWCVRAAKIGKLVKSHVVAGVFFNKGVSLSGSRDVMHLVERNVVCLRHGINDKLTKVDSGLMDKYDVDTIAHNQTK